MRTVRLDLDIAGTRLRVLCEDADSGELLRSALAEHLVDEPAPTGFVLRLPESRSSLHLLLDRSGLVLGRARSSEECLAILTSHLAAFLPPPCGTVRVRMRALVDHSGAEVTLAGFPLFATPPPIERQLDRVGYRLIDRLAVDVASDLVLRLTPPPWSELASLGSPRGHAAGLSNLARVARVVAPQISSVQPSVAQLVSFVSGALITDDGAGALDFSERLVQTSLVTVPLDDRSGRYEALVQPLGQQ